MRKRKAPREEPDCCFNCKSFSSRNGRKSFGYCMKFSTNKLPKDVCAEYSPVLSRRGRYV